MSFLATPKLLGLQVWIWSYHIMMQTSVVLVQARLAAAKAPKGHLPQLWQSTAVSLPPGIQKG
jgi:hypothetical protein